MKWRPSLFVPDVQRKQMSDHMDVINLLIVCHAACVSRGYDRNIRVFSVHTYADVIFFVSKVSESLDDILLLQTSIHSCWRAASSRSATAKAAFPHLSAAILSSGGGFASDNYSNYNSLCTRTVRINL